MKLQKNFKGKNNIFFPPLFINTMQTQPTMLKPKTNSLNLKWFHLNSD